MLVAIDAVAGRFAINGGDLPGDLGEVCYFGPDSLSWLPLAIGHGALVTWALGDGVDEFYELLRWPGWQRDIADLTPDRVVQTYPPLFSKEAAQHDPVTRFTVPWLEAVDLLDDFARQLPESGAFTIAVDDDEQ